MLKNYISRLLFSFEKNLALFKYKYLYVSIPQKFGIALLFSLFWAVGSYYLANRWIVDLANVTNEVISLIIIFGIAIIPGFMNAFLAASIALDCRPPRRVIFRSEYPAITILVAAYNEQENILSTIHSLSKQRYSGKMTVYIVNDGSKDNTVALVESVLHKYSWLRLIDYKQNMGKARALTEALKSVDTEYVITVDGDSCLYRNALRNIVERYLSDPPNTAAVAGSIMLKNHSATFCTKLQSFDYFIGISSVKRLQSMYHGTMVAQGAFSLYRTDVVRELGGWPHTVGEDIVLTWGILKAGYRVGHAEDAILFTNAPETFKQFINQRIRWSRGLVEAFKAHSGLLFKPRLSTLFIWWNLFFPYLDLVYTLAFVPGVILACFGYYWIAGPMTLIVLPVGMTINYLIYREQAMLTERQGIHFKRKFFMFVFYSLCYSLVLQPACVFGYIKEMVSGKIKNWGTK
jgi:poly-beta-1,6-N-acetyl-D-glucosamine synthase